ncbi:MAG: oligopeptide:H+ symporter, partial [Bacteroidota bacterium]
FLSTLTCGYVGEQVSWHLGFGLAGIGMAIGLIVFWIFSRGFGEKGLPPAPKPGKAKGFMRDLPVYAGSLVMIPVVAYFLNIDTVLTIILTVISIAVLGFFAVMGFVIKGRSTPYEEEGGATQEDQRINEIGTQPQVASTSTVKEKNKVVAERLWVVPVLFVFHAVFWALFEQAGGSLTLFTERNVDRMILGSEIPASVFQSLNPLYIILLAPVFSWIWLRLNKAKKEPSTPMKFVLGLAQLALGFAIIVIGARFFATEGTVPVIFLALMYLFHTTGELSLSPVGLSMVTKLSPAKIVGFVMGAWFLSISLANIMAGQIGKLAAVENVGENISKMETLTLYSSTYLTWGVYVVLGAAALLFVLVPLLRKWMHGIH